jgi:hypothetical protein
MKNTIFRKVREPMQSSFITIITAVAVFTAWGCSSSSAESGKAVEFAGSECKSHLYMPPSPGPALYTMEQSEPYQGLQCVSWELDETGTFSVDLINFNGACGAQYVGDYRNGDAGELNLMVNNPGCMIANCGYCVYDWSFEVEEVAATNLTINVLENACPEEKDYNVDTYTFEISEAELATGAGIACEYRDIGIFESPTCGTLHQPCNLLASDTGANDDICGVADTRCDAGYICVETEAMKQPTCVAECTEDEDCPLQPLLTCDNGRCLLK